MKPMNCRGSSLSSSGGEGWGEEAVRSSAFQPFIGRAPSGGSAKMRPSLERDSAQFTRQSRFERVRMHVAHGVKESGHLLLTGLDDSQISMTCRRHTKRRSEIQKIFSLHIPNVNTPGPFPNDRPRAIRLDERHVRRLVSAQRLQNLAGGRFQERS